MSSKPAPPKIQPLNNGCHMTNSLIKGESRIMPVAKKIESISGLFLEKPINGFSQKKGKQLKNCPLTKYALMCRIKTVSCFRIGKKKEKPRPRTVFKFGKQNDETKNYLSSENVQKVLKEHSF
jgi:hypothetical protein